MNFILEQESIITSYATDEKAHFKVAELDLPMSKLNRYKYCVVYAEPLIRDFTNISATDKPMELPARFPVFFLSETETENGEQEICGMQCNSIETDTFRERINASESCPVVIVVNEEDTIMIEEMFLNSNKTMIILIVKQLNDENEPRQNIGKHVVKYTSERSIFEDMDEALETYVFLYLERALESLQRSGKLQTFKHTRVRMLFLTDIHYACC